VSGGNDRLRNDHEIGRGSRNCITELLSVSPANSRLLHLTRSRDCELASMAVMVEEGFLSSIWVVERRELSFRDVTRALQRRHNFSSGN